MMRIGLLTCFFLIFCFSRLSAQYHLNEMGFRTGGGWSASTTSKYSSVYGFNLEGYYSHYVCGKRYGYHAEVGTRLQSGFFKDVPQEVRSFSDGFGFLHLGLHLGGYFKVRVKNYHRPSEVCLMVGPKVQLLSFMLTDMRLTHPQIITFMPGGHLSLWFRRPVNKSLSWFIVPGIEFYPGMQPGNFARYSFHSITVSETRLPDFSTLYVFLNVGFTVWNNR